jgi:AraC family ethanolamine operon transcriptional activator
LNEKKFSREILPIDGPDDLRETTRGSDIEVVQLKPGKLRGSITHFEIADLAISMGRFSAEIRMRGTLHPERVVLGTVLDSVGRVTQWWKDVQPGDVGVFPAGVEFDAVHSSGATYLVASIDLQELLKVCAYEDRLADPAFWQTKHIWRTDPLVGDGMLRRLTRTMSRFESKSTGRPLQAADFLKRSIIETFVGGLLSAVSPDRERSHYTGARLVSEAEDYVDAAGERPVDISELSSFLKVSRRSLHRAFADTLGMGPVTYLRRRRLSAIHSVLRRCDPETISIGDIAFEYGFPDAGRFAAYYRAQFGMTPSETCRRPSSNLRKTRCRDERRIGTNCITSLL